MAHLRTESLVGDTSQKWDLYYSENKAMCELMVFHFLHPQSCSRVGEKGLWIGLED